jgi:alpha-beta hydrolase superfamily lysophospholipase
MIRNLAAAAALAAFLAASGARAAAPPAAQNTVPPAPETPQDALVAVDGGQVGDDNVLLYGAFLRPIGVPNYPAVLIVPAQGLDKDGNAPGQPARPDSYKKLANDLALRGIASMRIDERGVGASAKALPHEEDLRFGAYVEDVVTWAKFLQAQPHVRCVALLGHSEGALVAALAAQQLKVCAVIEVAGAARPAAAVLADQLKSAADAGRLDPETYAQATRVLNTLASGKTAPDAPARLSALFRPSVQPFLISWLELDPVAAVKTTTPVLILQGSADPQVSPDDGRRLAAATAGGKLVVIAGADHDLKVTPAKPVAADDRPVAPEASAAIADFLKRLKS